MTDFQPGGEPGQDSKRPAGWRRPLSYLLLIMGGIATVFNGDLARSFALSTSVVQIAALALIVAGAALFFSVREISPDRLAEYRSLLRREEFPDPPPGTVNDPETGQPGEKKS